MVWLRLYLTVEGQTERKFADAVLKPHLANFSIDLRSRVVVTNRKLGNRGGIFNFAKIRDDLVRLMRQDQHPEAYFTTMIDLFALPKDFPGWHEAQKEALPQNRVTILERAFQEALNHRQFLPYIQLHEFETLLYCDLSQLARRITNTEKQVIKLAQEVAGIPPEEINDGETTAPSKRIIKYIPQYKHHLKVRVGAPAAAAIGLPMLRAKCPYFNEWITQLEQLSALFKA